MGLGRGGVGVTVDLAGTNVDDTAGGERVLVGSTAAALPAGAGWLTRGGNAWVGTLAGSAVEGRERAQDATNRMLVTMPIPITARRLIIAL